MTTKRFNEEDEKFILEFSKTKQKKIIRDIDKLIDKTIVDNQQYQNPHYWRWQFFMIGWDKLKKGYLKEK